MLCVGLRDLRRWSRRTGRRPWCPLEGGRLGSFPGAGEHTSNVEISTVLASQRVQRVGLAFDAAFVAVIAWLTVTLAERMLAPSETESGRTSFGIPEKTAGSTPWHLAHRRRELRAAPSARQDSVITAAGCVRIAEPVYDTSCGGEMQSGLIDVEMGVQKRTQ